MFARCPSATLERHERADGCDQTPREDSIKTWSGRLRPTEGPQNGLLHLRAKPRPDRLGELHQQLRQDAFIELRPFGKALTHSLNEARLESDGIAIWEEEDYCSPPLAQERAAVLDTYFDEITVERVNAGEGWKRIEGLPKLDANL
jgi:hypothetical protein